MDFFWAKGFDRKCSLILNHKTAYKPDVKLPTIRGINISLLDNPNDTSTLLLTLQDNQDREIFYKLCTDIIERSSLGIDEKESVSEAIAQTWRWHHLLRGGSNQRLNIEEQKGLIGELIVLRDILLPNLSPADSINSWTGPSGAPKDFEIGSICIESKARRSAAAPFVSINSEYQLDESSVEKLYLHVAELNQSPPETEESFTLTEMAQQLKNQIATEDQFAATQFEGLLFSSGFDWSHDYEGFTFLEGQHKSYEVKDDFPRITPENFNDGVSRVRYSVSLTSCSAHEIKREVISSAF